MGSVPERAKVATLSDVFISPKLDYLRKIQGLAKTKNDLHRLSRSNRNSSRTDRASKRGSNLWIEKICRKRSCGRCVRVLYISWEKEKEKVKWKAKKGMNL